MSKSDSHAAAGSEPRRPGAPHQTPGARYAMSHEPPVMMRAHGFEYDHEILVALPATYDVNPGKRYPVLWSMDGALLFDLAAGLVSFYAAGTRFPEMIVVGVGHRSEDGMAGLMRRTFDLFQPGTTTLGDEVGDEYMRRMMAELGVPEGTNPFAGVKGDDFLAFLVDQARPALAAKYRMADDHTLFGHSAGGAFTSYALFARPGDFQRYIIGSGTNPLTMDLEARHAAEHDDLPAKVFIGAGDLEANNVGMASQRIVSRTILLAENLLLRRYPSLEVTTRIYRDRDHYNVVPLILGDGLQAVFAAEAKLLAPPPW